MLALVALADTLPDSDNAESLYISFEKCFEVIDKIFDELLNYQDYETLRLACQVFSKVNQFKLAPIFKKDDYAVLCKWFAYLKTLLDIPVPEDLSSFTTDRKVV
jgi:hypothetical protein